jgi:pyruvate/2-oxoglutarate dehydrogenase complex dihydrolipoamide dehydrogenase (E3) component
MKYDAIILGSGQAGPGIAATLAGDGQTVAVVEADRLGGTCLNWGCKPTKTLRMSARAAHMARRSDDYGVQTGDVTVDFQAVMARKNRIIGAMKDEFVDYFENVENVTIYRAYGHFVGTQDGVHRVQAGDDLLEAERVFINVGARSFIPPIAGLDTVDYLTHKSLLEIDELPEHMIIVGGGYIGLEFGQMFRRFGSQISIVESQPHVASREDDDVREMVEDVLGAEGIRFFTERKAVQVEQTGGGVTVTLEDKQGQQTLVSGSHLLLAVGRRPNSDTIQPEAVGLALDDKGYIQTNGKFETNVPGIWALGDVNGRGAFTHTSVQDYEILLANFRGEERTANGRIMAYSMFIDPPLGHVGMHEKEARESDRNILIAKIPFSDVSRARLDSETDGLMKVLVDADSEEILGATVFGLQGDDVVQIFSYFMHTGASYKVMRDALPIHPTVGEYMPTLLGSLEPLD